jgi:predicted PurR-regulated permease PerM
MTPDVGAPQPPATGPSDRVGPQPARPSVRLQVPAPLMLAARLSVVALVVLGLYFGKDLFVPLALAALLAFLLDPWVTRLRRLHVPRVVAVGIVTVCALAAIGGATLLVGQQVLSLGKNLPQYQSTIETKLRTLRHRIEGDRSLRSATRLIDSVGQEVDATRKALDATGSSGSATRARPLQVQVASGDLSTLKTAQDTLMPVIEPLLTAGVAIVLLIFMLLQRNDLRDRVMRLSGGDLHHLTDALSEAAQRVSRYLTMQLVVNASYGVPLALGLWWIGVPGAILWGLLAATLRFVPYLGPVVAAVFPLVLAFAVDPGWSLLLWTLALVLTLELISNNFIEPWLYGSSTGLAALAMLLSAAFWTALWGPVGLLLATPMTVVLVVMGRHLPALRFLDVLLGNEPVFDAPTRLYQRLLAGNVEEAADMAELGIAKDGGLASFYSSTALPALGLASTVLQGEAGLEHRHRVNTGMARLLRELQRDHPSAHPPVHSPGPAQDVHDPVFCVGLRWEADALSSSMLAHALALDGLAAQALPTSVLQADAGLALGGASVVCLSTFHPDPEAMARHACRRLRRLQPDLQIVLGLWNAPAALREPSAAARLGASAVATSLSETLAHVRAMRPDTSAPPHASSPVAAPAVGDAASALKLCQRVDALRTAPALLAAQRAAEILDTPMGAVWWADGRLHAWPSDSGEPALSVEGIRKAILQPMLQQAQARVVQDVARDPQLCAAAASEGWPHRFVAAVPLTCAASAPLGVLFVLDTVPRTFGPREQRLLDAVAQDLVQRVELEAQELEQADVPTSGASPTSRQTRPDPPLDGAELVV